jgi:hypothetical protein
MSSATAAKVQIAAQSSTAEDTRRQKQRNEGAASGGCLVATALKHEGVDTGFVRASGAARRKAPEKAAFDKSCGAVRELIDASRKLVG